MALTLVLLLASGWCAPPARGDVDGNDVRQAIRRANAWLYGRQNPDGTWPGRDRPGGVTCLATLALLQAGESPDSLRIERSLEHIRDMPNQHVYVVALKIMVLSKVDAQRYRREINAAAQWLVSAQNRSGLWNYTEEGTRFDHSNSQFALLGLHAAAQVGIKIPSGVWQRARRTVLKTQNKDGGWAYQASGESYGSMTAAGVADLLILGHRLAHSTERGFSKEGVPKCGGYRTSRPLAEGLAWLGGHFEADRNPRLGRQHYYYWMYAVERCGILSGRRYLGRRDWYREGAEQLVDRQRADGSWGGSLTDTCFAVLFLAKGHKSLLIQKLQWSADDAWSPVRYDLPHLIAFIGDKLGEPVAWQAVPFDAPVEAWLEAPLLLFHGHEFPEWNAEQRAKLRKYVELGGTILAEAAAGSDAFRAGFEEFAAQTFPETPLRLLGPDHAVYRLLYDVQPYRLRGKDLPNELRGIDLGCRTSVFFSPRDLSCLWERARVPHLSERAFQLGTNIAAYAIGRRPLRDRLDAVVLPATTDFAPGPPRQDALRLAQVVYGGDWRPFPLALTHLAAFLRDELNFDVITGYRQIQLTDEDLYACPVLYLAGHFDFELSKAERDALAGHLRRGGFLIADACCGTDPFDGALRRMLQQAFPEAKLERLPADHPVFAGTPGFRITSVAYSPDVLKAHPGLNQPELWGMQVNGRLAIVYSPYSLGCGLSGPVFEGCWGLASEDARHLAANIVLYAMTH